VSTPEQRHRAVLAEIREASRIFRARNNTERKFRADHVQPRDLIGPSPMFLLTERAEFDVLARSGIPRPAMGLAARFVAQLFGDGTDAALRAQLLMQDPSHLRGKLA
jgi:hypothetical protein